MKPLAISLGDPSGIGPEIIAKAWAARVINDLPVFFAVGDARSIEAVWQGPLVRITDPSQAVAIFPTALPVFEIEDGGAITPGVPNVEGARCALDALELVVGLARSGAVSGVVTGPISKAQLYAIGFTHPGQTEFIAERCGVARDNVIMMLAGGGLRVVPVTIHVALSAVSALLTTDLIVAKGRATARALQRNFGISTPRIAVAGLNPHAGEDGALGTEEIRVIGPAIDILKSEGLDVFGPVPPDALFTPRARPTFDVALCMYHDQALIPIKALYFDEGVNMTLGLPIIRTAPDHGTAFDIAGHNKADPSAMIAAIRAAAAAAHFRAHAE